MKTRQLHKKGRGQPRGPRAGATKSADKFGRIPSHATLRKQYVHCGKRGCLRRHGPYWYAFWFKGGRTRSAYVGSMDRLAELLARWGHVAPDDEADRLENEHEFLGLGRPMTRGRRRRRLDK